MKYFLIILSLSFLCLCSCATIARMNADWKEVKIDGPWMSSTCQAREFTRTYVAGVMHSGSAGDTKWTSDAGSVNQFSIRNLIANYMHKTGMVKDWQRASGTSNGIEQRLAPYTFHVVSVLPTVVIMVPKDYGDINQKSTSEIIGNRYQNQKPYLTSPHVINPIEYGTSVPYSDTLVWFSPDLKQTGKTKLNPDGGEISQSSFALKFTKDSSYQWKIHRLK